jgi:hypothetical protein
MDLVEVRGDQTVQDSTHPRGEEKGKQGPATAKPGNEERYRPARDLYQSAKEIIPIYVLVVQIGHVQGVSVVAHERHHAKTNY